MSDVPAHLGGGKHPWMADDESQPVDPHGSAMFRRTGAGEAPAPALSSDQQALLERERARGNEPPRGWWR